MFDIKNIRAIHLEITSKCNAACPQCGRNDAGGKTYDWLNLLELSFGQIHRLLSPNFLKQIHHIFACGNYGDAIVAKDTLQIFQYFRSWNVHTLRLHTNGSARSTDWWAEAGKVFSNSDDMVIFGLDGLKDTNHIYRRRTNWKKIMENVESFIGAGGRAEWQFIPFKHNEHQIEEAKNLSKEMGFAEFMIMSSNRFFYETGSYKSINKTPIKNEAGEIEGYIEIPTNPKLQHPQLNAEWHDSEIECKAILNSAIYIDAGGKIFPCCWTGLQRFDESIKMNNTTSIADAVENEFNDLAAQWKDMGPPVCKNFCSVKNHKAHKVASRLKFDIPE